MLFCNNHIIHPKRTCRIWIKSQKVHRMKAEKYERDVEMELNYVRIGQRVRACREKKKMTQEMLSERSGISVNHLSHIERANTKVGLPTLVKVANALDATIDDFLCDSMPQIKTPFVNAITELAEDCNTEEIRMYTAVLQTMKETYRELRKKDDRNESRSM